MNFYWRYVYLIWPSEYLIKKPPVPTKWARVSLIKVKSGNALLRILLAYIRSYLKSILRCKYLILGTYHCIYVRKDVMIRGHFSEPKGAREQTSLINTEVTYYSCGYIMFLCSHRFLFGRFTRCRIAENKNFKLEYLIDYLLLI